VIRDYYFVRLLTASTHRSIYPGQTSNEYLENVSLGQSAVYNLQCCI